MKASTPCTDEIATGTETKVDISPGHASGPTIDQALKELKASRRLEDVLVSVESFLLGQVARIEEAMAHCQQAMNQQETFRQLLADFEQQKETWQQQRQAEEKRLMAAGERLIEGWQQLEAERQGGVAK